MSPKKWQKSNKTSQIVIPTGYLNCFEIYCWGKYKNYDDSVKMVEGEVPFNKFAVLFDLSLFVKGADEDKHFMMNPHCYQNIRRGNTLFSFWEVYKPEIHGIAVDEKKIDMIGGKQYIMVDIYWGRRGMFKFFDVYIEFLDQSKTVNLDTHGSFSGNFLENYGNSERHKIELRKIIFKQVELSFIERQKVITCYKLIKANGENAQISYNAQIDSWMCASKNVCLAARNRKDIDLFNNKDRFSFARLIAEAWFNFLDRLKPEQVQELKREMNGFSWIGEYCGDQNHQHLVLYTKITILFYAIVDHNQQEDPCIPPLQAYLTFRKFKCDTVSLQSLGTFSKISEMYSSLQFLFKQVASGTIRDEEEGSVLYFVRTNPQYLEVLNEIEQYVTQGKEMTHQEKAIAQALSCQKTLSLCKLKTLEYRIYRKLREKLKSHTQISQYGKSSNKISQFKQEAKELIEGHELPKPIEYYFQVAEAAFQYLEQNPRSVSSIQEGYINFIQTVIAQVDGQLQVIPPMLSKQFGEQNLTEEELKKFTEIQQIQTIKPLTQNETQIPKLSCVLLTPPLFLSQSTISNIKSIFGIPQSNEVLFVLQNINEIQNIYNISIVPKDTKPKVIYIIAGWTQNGIIQSEKQVLQLKESKQSPPNPQVSAFYHSQQLPQMLKQNWNNISNFYKNYKSKVGDFLEDYGDLNGEQLIEAIKQQFNNCVNVKLKITPLIEEIKQELPPPPLIQENQKVQESLESTFVVVVPMGIPGMGKTYNLNIMTEILKELNVNVEIVSSDKVRKQCMEEYMKKNHNYDEELAFNKTNEPARTQFFNRVQTIVRQANKQPGRSLLFLDKNHPQNSINGTFSSLRKACSQGQNMKIVALLPQCEKPFQLKNTTFPFSIDLLVTCLIRAMKRQDHETLNGTDDKKVAVVMMFFNMYRNMDLSNQSLKQLGFSHVIRVPFASEGNNLDPQLIQLLQNVLQNLPNGSFPGQQETEQLTQYLQKNEVDLKPTDSKQIQQMAKQAFLECFEISQIQPIIQRNRPLPIFIGVEVNQDLQPILLTVVRSALKGLSKRFPNEGAILNDSQEFISAKPITQQSQVTSNWSLPKDLHLTTLFIGGDRSLQNSVNEFPEGETVYLEMTAFVYVPGKLMCSIVVQDKQKDIKIFTSHEGKLIQVNNKIPHITLLLNQWPAKNSNLVLESLGSQHGPLSSHLKNNFFYDQSQTLVEQYNITVNKENVKAYVMKLCPALLLKGQTKLYY